MYIFKVIENNEITFVGTAEKMDFSKNSYISNQQWWKEKDKVLYTEIDGSYSANFYKKILRALYGLDKDDKASTKLIIHEGSVIDNLDYKVFFDSELEDEIPKNARELAEENRKRKEKIQNNKKKINEYIRRTRLHPQLDEDLRFVPLHSGYYPKTAKINYIHELMKILIVIPKDYSLKGLREIKRLYLKIIEEKTNTLISQKDIDKLIDEYGEFWLLKTNGDHCDRAGCSYSPLFTSPAYFIKRLNYKEYEEKFGFELYDQNEYFYKIGYRLYCSDCGPKVKESIKQAEIDRKKEVIRRSSHGIEIRDREFWRDMILELDDELRQTVGVHLSNIYRNSKDNLWKAEQSIKVLYDLKFARKIPNRIIDKRPFILGIFYVGDYYYEINLSKEFKRIKNLEVSDNGDYE